MSTPADTTPMQARRRAALALHALHPEDRRRVLEAWAPPRRQQLQPLLDELVELGIPPDAASLPLPTGSQGLGPELLAAPDLHQLADLLRAEPPRLARALIDCGPWPWAARLARLVDLRADREAGDAGDVAPAFAQSLRKAVADELSRRREPRAAVPPRRWLWRIRELAGRLR